MTEKYKILYQGGIGENTEKKSRFIANTQAVTSEEEAIAFLEKMKKKYWDANHNCFAYVIGSDRRLQHCSDDGEPARTAGRPILDVILGEGICDICIVVTRYFGGTLLGTGGLVRAYSKAAKAGLDHSLVVEKHSAKQLDIITDYNGAGKIQYLIGQMGIHTLNSQYTDQVIFSLLVPISQIEKLKVKIMEITNGKSQMTEIAELYYGILEKEIVLFP